MSTKTISVNPEYFNLKKTKKSKKKKRFNKTINNRQKNDLKEKLISKIKKFKKKNKYNLNDRSSSSNKKPISFNNDYDEAVDFMEDIVKKNKKKKKRKMDKQNNIQKEINVNTEQLKNSFVSNDPPFGILKNGGKKPLYSQYMKEKMIDNKIKNENIVITDENKFGKNINVNQEFTNIKNNIKNDILERKINLENLKKTFMKNNNIKDENEEKNKTFKIKNKKILKRFKLGKNKKSKKVSILIKNKKTRKIVQKDERELKRKKMKDIKKFLVERSLIKAGSSAPSSLLKDIYTNCYLSGDIYNTGGKSAEENIMHNWNKDF